MSRRLIISFAFSVWVAFLLPLQTYLGNSNLFAFTFLQFLCEQFLFLLIIWAFVAAIQYSCRRNKIALLIDSVILGLTLCIYAESVIMAFALPPLDGGAHSLENVKIKLIDTIVLLAFFSAPIVLNKFIRDYFHYVALILLVMGGASVFDVKVNEDNVATSVMRNGMRPKVELFKTMTLSQDRNVFFLIIDSLSSNIATDVIESDGRFREVFEGFRIYKNNIGMHECTVRGAPGLMTGQYYEGGSLSDYVADVFGKQSFLSDYIDVGAGVYFSSPLFENGYSNSKRLENPQHKSDDSNSPCVIKRMKEIPHLNLYEISRYRVTPWVLKFKFLTRAMAHAKDNNEGFDALSERNVLPLITSAPASNEKTLTLIVVHTQGIHDPVLYDRYGNRWDSPRYDENSIKESAYYVIDQIGEFCQRLKEIGLYDSSSIVVTADHGRGPGVGPETEELCSCNCALWYKPAHATSDFLISNAPTSSSRIRGLMQTLSSRDVSAEEADTILSQEVRKFRGRFPRKFVTYEWIYDKDNKIVKKINLGLQ